MSIASNSFASLSNNESGSSRTDRRLSRRTIVAGAWALAAALLVSSIVPGALATARSGQVVPRGPGSASGAPDLPAGFTRTFSSQYVQAGGIRQHVVIGGDGPPLLLVHGWPQTWYAWRLVMPELAKHFRVIAVDQRGIGLTDKPRAGYDVGTLGNDLAALMTALGHEHFFVYGTDTGMPIAYALAADHPERVDRLVMSEATIPGVTPSPALLQPALQNARLWHLMFNQLPAEVNEALVRGREGIFFGAEFDASAGSTKLAAATVRYYVDRLSDDRDALRGSFSWYRALFESGMQNVPRATTKLQMPVLAIGGKESASPFIGPVVLQVAANVQVVEVPGGHWVAETAPDAIIRALLAFLT